MPKSSSKEKKNIYFRLREELGLTREEASEALKLPKKQVYARALELKE